MRIALITPYLPETRNGNAHTALRWRRFLRAAGHRVVLAQDWDGWKTDAMIALHARRSHGAIARCAHAHPDRPLFVVLTGTDLYRDIRTDPDACESLRLATRLVVLQGRGLDELAPALRAKARVIYQSAPSRKPGRKARRDFDLCVVAHLREEKDPFRAAYATGLLPPDSRIRVRHVGGALSPDMAAEAASCDEAYPRWRWLGPRGHGEARRWIAASRLLVLSSRLEGGANVICEAVTAGVPVLASDIPGNLGMLGEDYPGYYPVGDTAALAGLMDRAEREPVFYAGLAERCAARAALFHPAREAAAVQDLLREAAV
jgi:putative glycosyltransferase (TIGR04348 family)